MASLFQLVGSIFIDNEQANQSLQKTESKASSVGTSLLNGAKKAGKFAMGLTTAAAGAATALTATAKSSAESMDAIDKASQRMEVSAETYQEFEHVAGLCGVEMSTLEKAAKRLDEGISFEDAMEQIYALEDANERAQLASELFGESVAYNLTPMLNASGTEMEAMKQEAHDLGLVFSEDAVKGGAALNDALSNVQSSLGSLVTGIGNDLAPILLEVCNFITDNLPVIQGMFDKLSPILIKLFETLMPQLMSLAETLLPVIVDLFDLLLPVFSDICETVLPILVKLISKLLPTIIQIAEKILPIIVTLLEALLPILDPLLDLISPLLELAVALLTPLLDLINLILPPLTELFAGLVTQIAEHLGPAIEWLVDVFKTMYDKVKEYLKGLKDTFKDTFEKIVDFVKTPVNTVIKMMNSLMSGVVTGINTCIKALNNMSFDVPDWVPKIGGEKFGFNLKTLTAPSIPLLANGAVIEPNKPFAAVLGDQKNGTNIEAPLDTIKQAVSEVLASMDLNVNINASPDTKKWFSAMQVEGKAYNKRTGRPSMA